MITTLLPVFSAASRITRPAPAATIDWGRPEPQGPCIRKGAGNHGKNNLHGIIRVVIGIEGHLFLQLCPEGKVGSNYAQGCFVPLLFGGEHIPRRRQVSADHDNGIRVRSQAPDRPVGQFSREKPPGVGHDTRNTPSGAVFRCPGSESPLHLGLRTGVPPFGKYPSSRIHTLMVPEI